MLPITEYLDNQTNKHNIVISIDDVDYFGNVITRPDIINKGVEELSRGAAEITLSLNSELPMCVNRDGIEISPIELVDTILYAINDGGILSGEDECFSFKIVDTDKYMQDIDN